MVKVSSIWVSVSTFQRLFGNPKPDISTYHTHLCTYIHTLTLNSYGKNRRDLTMISATPLNVSASVRLLCCFVSYYLLLHSNVVGFFHSTNLCVCVYNILSFCCCCSCCCGRRCRVDGDVFRHVMTIPKCHAKPQHKLAYMYVCKLCRHSQSIKRWAAEPSSQQNKPQRAVT